MRTSPTRAPSALPPWNPMKPDVMATIPNAQTAVIRTAVRWVGRGRRQVAPVPPAEDEREDRPPPAAATKAGARLPVGPNSVSRTGAAAVAAP